MPGAANKSPHQYMQNYSVAGSGMARIIPCVRNDFWIVGVEALCVSVVTHIVGPLNVGFQATALTAIPAANIAHCALTHSDCTFSSSRHEVSRELWIGQTNNRQATIPAGYAADFFILPMRNAAIFSTWLRRWSMLTATYPTWTSAPAPTLWFTNSHASNQLATDAFDLLAERLTQCVTLPHHGGEF
jgi:hypothetical protein